MSQNASKFSIILFSRIWTALISILFVPVYIKIIGVESYGLVAFFATLSGSLAILDLGLSTAISRQVAIFMTQPNKEKESKDLIFSVEIIYWLIALVVGLLVVMLAEPIALYWIKTKDLPVATVHKAVMLMGAVFAVQFPASIYNGVLIGYDRQIANALVTLIFTTFKVVGVIAILKYVSPTIESYFIWQVLITLISTYCLRVLVWNSFKVALEKAHFSVVQLKTIWRFSAGMTGISLVTFFLSQIDKIVVSKFVILEFVGYYNLAFLVSSGITQVLSPMQPILFPKFTALVAENRQTELVSLYHKSCRWIAIIVLPIGFVLILFAKEILFLWTSNPTLTENTAPIVQVVTAGTICNTMMWVPYWYMLAKGKTKFTIYQNLIASIILVPFLFWWTSKYGALGASFVWLAVNSGYILISMPIFHRLYMKGEFKNWFKNDISRPLVSTLVLAVFAKYLHKQMVSNLNILPILLILCCCLFLYFLIIPELREIAYNFKNKYLK